MELDYQWDLVIEEISTVFETLRTSVKDGLGALRHRIMGESLTFPSLIYDTALISGRMPLRST